MTHERDIERILDHWFADGPNESPDRVIDIVADRIERQSQRPAWRSHLRETHMDRYLKPLLAVAAVVAVAVVAYDLVPIFGSRGVGAVASPTPTASEMSSTTPSNSPSPSPTTDSTPFPCGDGGTGCVGDLTAGANHSRSFAPPLTFEVPDGWQNVIDNDFFYSLDGPDPTSPTIDVWSQMSPVAPGCNITVQPGVADTVDGWVGWLTTQPGIVATAPREAEVGGYVGQTIELRVAKDWTQTCDYMDHPGVWLVNSGTGFARNVDSNTVLTLTILDVAGQTVMIGLASGTAPEDQPAIVAAAKPIIDSFTFTP